MNFFQLPVVTSTQVSDVGTGVPFTEMARNLAWYGQYNFYVGTDDGTVYIARVKNDLYFVCIGSGYYGYTWITDSLVTAKWEVKSTQYSTIYMVKGPSIPSMYTWNIDLTNFANTDDMLSMFYDTYVDTSSPDGIVVRVVASNPDSNADAGESEPTTDFPTEDEGYFDEESDEVPPSALPNANFSGTASGLVTLFRPTLDEINSLGRYLWTNLTDFIENLNKLFVNPMDYMIALNIFPVTPPVDTAREIKIGSFSTSISMPPVTSQWYEFDCGTITIHPFWGSYLDYAPYTKIHAMLPFIGSVSLNTDEVMNQVLGLRYRIDLLSGQCVALITIDNSVYYQFAGECALAIPLTGSDWSRVYSAATAAIGTAITGGIGAAGSAAGISAGGAAAIAANGEAVSDLLATRSLIPKGTRGITQMRNELQEMVDMNMNAAREVAQSNNARAASLQSSRLANTGSGIVSQVMTAKGHVQHSGTISGSASVLGERSAYVMLEYPNQSLPDNYKHFVGYPSNIYAKLSTLSGYTECEQVIVEGLTGATDSEISEITDALKGGVYL